MTPRRVASRRSGRTTRSRSLRSSAAPRGGGGKRKRAAGGALAACAEDEDDGKGAATARKRARGAAWAAPSTTSRARARAAHLWVSARRRPSTEATRPRATTRRPRATTTRPRARRRGRRRRRGRGRGRRGRRGRAAALRSAHDDHDATARRRALGDVGSASTATAARARERRRGVARAQRRDVQDMANGRQPWGGAARRRLATTLRRDRAHRVEDARAEAEADGAARAEADGPRAPRPTEPRAPKLTEPRRAPPRALLVFGFERGQRHGAECRLVVSSSGARSPRLRRRGGGDPIRARVDDDDDDASSAAARSRRTTPTEVASPTELMSDDGVGAQPHSPAMPSSAVARAQFSSVRARARDSDARAAEDADAADDDEELPLEARLRQRAAGTSDRISFASAADGDARDADSADDAEDDAGSARGGGGARVLSAAPSQVTASTEALPTAESATARVQRAAEPCDAAASTEAAGAEESDQKPRARRPTPAAWACSACTFENQARRTRCEMCRTVRVPAVAAGSEPERSAAEPRVEPIALASRGEQHACAAPRPSPLRAARATASREGGPGARAVSVDLRRARDARAAAPIDEPPGSKATPAPARAPFARRVAALPTARVAGVKPAPHAGEVALAASGMRSTGDLVLAVAQAVGCRRTLWVAPREPARAARMLSGRRRARAANAARALRARARRVARARIVGARLARGGRLGRRGAARRRVLDVAWPSAARCRARAAPPALRVRGPRERESARPTARGRRAARQRRGRDARARRARRRARPGCRRRR